MAVTKTFFLKVAIAEDGTFFISAVREFFDYNMYIDIQRKRSRECPINRNATRETYPYLHDVSEEELTKHEHELMVVFFESEGAKWASEHIKPLCVKLEEKPLDSGVITNPDCIFLNLGKLCNRCAECCIKEILNNLKSVGV
ncbi:MAG: hypothetical protein PHN69_01815 [Candidatus Pacebacteria bacterium]|nr:hypothetical protein [Candidatus Paceibacterota bacterium]